MPTQKPAAGLIAAFIRVLIFPLGRHLPDAPLPRYLSRRRRSGAQLTGV
jgi:hypothetical protein